MSQEIDVQDNGNCYRISFNYKADTVRIYKSTINVLGNPRFIHFLINPERKQLFIQGSNTREHDSLEVPGSDYRNRYSFVLHGRRCIKKISTMAGWDLDGSYTLTGKYLDGYNMVQFELEAAERRIAEPKSEE